MTMTFEETEIKARWFATIHEGKIVTLGEAIPPHNLRRNQIILTQKEYRTLDAISKTGPLGFNIEDTIAVLQSVQAKIKANQGAANEQQLSYL